MTMRLFHRLAATTVAVATAIGLVACMADPPAALAALDDDSVGLALPVMMPATLGAASGGGATLSVHNQAQGGLLFFDQAATSPLLGPTGDQGPPGSQADAACLAGCDQVVPGIDVLGTIRARATFPAGLVFPAAGPDLDAVIKVTSSASGGSVHNFGPTAPGNGMVLTLLQRDPDASGQYVLSTEVGAPQQFFTTVAGLLSRLAGLSSRVFVILAMQGDLLALADVNTVAAGETETNLGRLFTTLEGFGAPPDARHVRSGEPFIFVGYRQAGMGNGFFVKANVETAAVDLNADSTPDGRTIEASVLLVNDHIVGPSSRSATSGGARVSGGPLRIDGDGDGTGATFTEAGGKLTLEAGGVLAVPQGGLQVGGTADAVDLGTDALTVGGVVAAGGNVNIAGGLTAGGGFGNTGLTLTSAGVLNADGDVTAGGNVVTTGGLTLGGGTGSTGITMTDAGVVTIDGLVTANGGLALGGSAIAAAGAIGAAGVALAATTTGACSTAGTLAYYRGELHVCDGTQLVRVGFGAAPGEASKVVELFDIDAAAPDLSGFTLTGQGSFVAAGGGVDAHYSAAAHADPNNTGAALTRANMVLSEAYAFELVLQSNTYQSGLSECPIQHGTGSVTGGNLHMCMRGAQLDVAPQEDNTDNDSVQDNAIDFDEISSHAATEGLTPGTKYHLLFVHEINNGRSIYINGIRRVHINPRNGNYREYVHTSDTFYIGGHDSDTNGSSDEIRYFRLRMYAHPLNSAQAWDACKSSGFESGGNLCGVIP